MPYYQCRRRRLFYREAGEGELLLVLPGNTASSAHHEGELAYYGRRWRAVAPDFWGTGHSDRMTPWPDDWYTQAAHDMVSLITYLSAGRAYVLGTSGGGVVALLLAILHPNQVAAVIAGSCQERLPPTARHSLAADRARRTPEQIAFWRAGHGDDWEQVVDADTQMLLRLIAQGGAWFGGRLKEVRCPVLLTVSLADDLLSEPGAQVCHMVQQIPTSRAMIFPEGAHPLMWSRPQEFRQAAEGFLHAVMQSH